MSRRPIPPVCLVPPQAMLFSRAVRAVSIAASTDDARELLTGVRIETTGPTTIRVEATDSYRLHRVDLDLADSVRVLPAYEATVPASFLKLLPSKRIREDGVWLDLSTRDRFGWSHAGEIHSIATIPVPAKFRELTGRDWPDTDKVIADALASKKRDRGARRAFNPKYLADIHRAASLLFPGDYAKVEVTHLDPMRPCRFDITNLADEPTMTAILMPIRISPKRTSEVA